MGASQSKTGGGNSKVQGTSKSSSVGNTTRTEIQEKMDRIMTQLLNRHITKFQDKSFCKRTKLFVRDRVLMHTPPQALGELGGEVFVGEVVGGADDRPELCDRLAHHYLKKINLVASIHATLRDSYARLDALQNGGQCYSEKPLQISEKSYEPLVKAVRSVKTAEGKEAFPFETRHTLEVDGDAIRKMALDKLKAQKITLPVGLANHHLTRELHDPVLCRVAGGEWLDTKEALQEKGLQPSERHGSYNKAWHQAFQRAEGQMLQKAGGLMNILDRVILEEVQEVDGKKQKVYQDKGVTDAELGALVQETKGLLEEISAEVEKVYLEMSTIPVIGDRDLDQRKDLEQKQKDLSDELKGMDDRFRRSGTA